MPFNIGSVFSPEMLNMVEREKDRRQSNVGLQAQLYRGREEDKFRKAQLRASVDDNNADRASREKIAGMQTDSRRDLADQNMQYREQALNERTRSANALLDEKGRQFDTMFPVQQTRAEAAKTRAEAATTNAGARSDQVALNREVEFGANGDPSNPETGSKAAGRRLMEGKTAADTDLAHMRSEVLTAKIDGMLPEDFDRKRRTDILEASAKLHERAFKIQSTKDAERIAIDLIRAMRNPVTGTFNDPSAARAMSTLAGQIFGVMDSFKPEFAAAFADAFQKVGKEEQDTANDEWRTKNNKHDVGTETGDQRAQKMMKALEAMREAARKRAEGSSPNPVGR